MNRLQEELFELMCEFDKICKKNNITYYLCGGTLLGALRHKGFIPWDDDVDVNMTYKEYKKLENVIEEELPEGRVFLSKERYKEYNSPVPRYMRLDSTLIRRNHLADGTPQGVYMDIIILDPIPVDEASLNLWRKKHYVYCELLEPQYIIAARKRDWRDIDTGLYRKYQEKCNIEGRDAVLKELETDLFEIDEKKAENYCMRFGTVWVGITPIKWYGNGRETLFEGKPFPIPEKAEMEMYTFYGLGWKQIPEDKETHKTLKLTEIECGNFEREFFRGISRQEFNEVFFKYNDLAIDKYKLKIDTYFDKCKPYMEYIIHKVEKRVEKYGEDELRNDIELGLEVFKEYMDLQLSYEFASNGHYIPLSEDMTNLLAEILLKSEKADALTQILKLRKECEGVLTENLEEYLKYAENSIDLFNSAELEQQSKVVNY